MQSQHVVLAARSCWGHCSEAKHLCGSMSIACTEDNAHTRHRTPGYLAPREGQCCRGIKVACTINGKILAVAICSVSR